MSCISTSGPAVKLQLHVSKADIKQSNNHEQKDIAPSDPHYPLD